MDPALAQRLVVGLDRRVADLLHAGDLHLPLGEPGPGVAEAELWQDGERSVLFAAVEGRDLDQDIVDVLAVLGVLDIDVKIFVLVEDARVEEFVLGLGAVAGGALVDELLIGEGRLWVFVQVLGKR